jgi:hypothetical protein
MAVTYFLGKNKYQHYGEMLESLIQHDEVLHCRMSVKLHYLHSHREFFRPNLGDVSEEHGKCIHQDIETIEKRCQGQWVAAMMGDYAWGLLCAAELSSHSRRSTSTVHF